MVDALEYGANGTPRGYQAKLYRIRGQRLLQKLLPACRVEAKRAALRISEESRFFASIRPYVSEANFDTLMVYPAQNGGFAADLVLKWTPPGVPDSIGSPTCMPLATFRDAEDEARKVLVLALTVSFQTTLAPPREVSPPVFVLDGWSVDLNPAILHEMESNIPASVRQGPEARARATAWLERVRSRLLPGGFDGIAWQRLSADERGEVLLPIYMAVLAHETRYPASPIATPREGIVNKLSAGAAFFARQRNAGDDV